MKENQVHKRRHTELGENPGTPWGHTPPVQENNLQNVLGRSTVAPYVVVFEHVVFPDKKKKKTEAGVL